MMQHHYDTLRGFSASIAGFGAYIITHSEFDRWIGTLAGLLGLVLVVLTIAEKVHQWRQRNRASTRREESPRLPLWVLAPLLLMNACAPSRNATAILDTTLPVSRAEVIAARSRTRVETAHTHLAQARNSLSELEGGAAAHQQPTIRKVEIALEQSQNLLRAELDENIILSASLKEAQDGLTRVLLEQERILGQLESARRRARAYLRLKLWLSALAALVAGWIAWRCIPLWAGPWRLYACAGSGAAAFGIIMMVL